MGELIPETTGPAMWGQDGVYSARDDRLAVTALAMGRTGVVREAEFTPEPGTPDITVAAGWMAVADSGDGSLMVVAGAEPGAVQALPGGETPRVDVIWADVFPDQGRWVLAVLRQEDTEERAGIALGTVEVPALAETADEMTVNPEPPNFNTFGEVGPAGPPGPQGPPGPEGAPGAPGIGGGVIAYGQYVDTYASRSAGSFASAASLGVATATTQAGRIYRVRSFSPAGHKVTGSLIAMICALTRGTGLVNTQVNPTGTQLGGQFTHPAAQVTHARPLWAEYVGPLPAGTAQYALRVWVGDGTYHTDSYQHGITTTIEDLGPA